ncbi:MAG: hypothetical protein M0Z83_05555 [Betaproteobacteria bacterium]|nr:hypothetical protein [Betaproteobacteria bacterium]
MQVKKIVSGVSAALWLMCYTSAFGAGLGKIWVNSKLGQPLSADVELIVPDSAELKSLHARMGSADAFNKANLEMTSALESVHFSIHSKSDGSMFVHLSSEKPVTDPFLDMIIELDWRNGQLLREYTLLLDPVDMPSPTSLVVAPASVSTASVAAQQPVSPNTQTITVNAIPKPESHSAPRQVMNANANVPSTQSVPNTIAETVKMVKIRRGETLSSIAIQNQPSGVHLDQMLVGLYRENTQAFDGNMNRMKVGQVLRIPGKDTLTAISEASAAREIRLQTEDWHNYRQKLAGEVEHSTVKKSSANEISGNVTAAVQQKTPPPTAGTDVLKLSHSGLLKAMQPGAANTQPTPAEQKRMNQDDTASSKKALEEEKTRTAMLEKSVNDLKQLLALKSQQLARMQPPPAEVKSKPTIQAVKNVTPKVSEKPLITPTPSHPAPVPVPAPVPSVQKWYAALNPIIAVEAIGGMALLGLLGLVVRRHKRRLGLGGFEDSMYAGANTNPKTTYDTQRGESVNTKSNTFSTNFSQAGLGILDTHDVDPVAEAEVYMAYGRDGQAEEILKEAMLKYPERYEIKVKLLEIYARRHAVPDFETLATDLYSMLSEVPSTLWEQVAEMGRGIDPHNPMYYDEHHVLASPAEDVSEPVDEIQLEAEPVEAVQVENATEHHPPVDDIVAVDTPQSIPDQSEFNVNDDTDLVQELDFSDTLNFDFSLDKTESTTPADTQKDAQEEAGLPSHQLPYEVLGEDEYSMNWEAPVNTGDEPQQGGSAAHELLVVEPSHDTVQTAVDEIVMSADDSHEGDMEFELGGISDSHDMADLGAKPVFDQLPMLDFSGIDLNFESEPSPAPTGDAEHGTHSLNVVPELSEDSNIVPDLSEDSNIVPDLSEEEQESQTKLELVQVYQEMGDMDNAREILQEVIAEGNSEQRGIAEAMLKKLDVSARE